MTVALLCLLTAPIALAADAEPSPEFLLGDLGVRVDLPKSWKMLRWSDWDFKAETKDTAVKLFVWASPLQHTPTEGDLPALSRVHLDKADALGVKEPSLSASRLDTKAGIPVARFDLSFMKGRGVMFGATLPIEGQMLHLVTLGASIRTARVRKSLDDAVKALEIQKPPAPVEANAQVSAKGITTRLPQGWRVPLDLERAVFNKRISVLGLQDLDDCWVALRTHANASPDAMVTCQGGILLGVVDQYSFDGKEAELRPKLFGKAPVPAAQRVDLSDRVGFLYAPTLGADALLVAAVPYDQGVARTWVLGQKDDPSLEASLRAALDASSWSGPHPTGLGDQAAYWLGYRLTSPLVFCPLLGLGGIGLAGIAGLGFLLLRGRKDKYADLDQD